MTKELELKLVEKYPDLLRDYGGDCRTTCMAWGIECSDQWYNILDHLFGYLTSLMKSKLYIRYTEEYRKKNNVFDFKMDSPKIVLDQVKSKFSSLRCYYHGENQEVAPEIMENLCQKSYDKELERFWNRVDDAIDFAEYQTSVICEECGKEGKLYTKGWWVVLCDEHAKKKNYDIVKDSTEVVYGED